MTAALFEAEYSLPEIANPGMITPEEEQLYFHLAKIFWSPRRFYLEVGTWLGRSTTRICQGLEAAAPSRWRLNCYDLFRWQADHIPKAERAGMPAAVANLKSGESFRDAFLTLMGDYQQRITTFEGHVENAPTILAGAFTPDSKLGVLFVDASKGWANGQLLKAVAQNLTEGTRIVFQDFMMNSAVYLQLLLMLLPQMVAETVVHDGGSMVFKVVDDISAEDPLFDPKSIKTLSADMIYGACERLESSMPRSKYDQAALATTLPVLLWKGGFEAEAHRAAERMALSPSQLDIIGKRTLKQPILNIPPITSLLGQVSG